MKRYIGLTLLFLFTVMCTNSFAVVITVGSGNAQPGQSVVLPITVDTPGEIAGAAFTLTYDTTNLILTSITSTFFDTFTNQWNALSQVPDPLPPGSVEVDGVTYTQPLVKNSASGGMSIAAARCQAGATSSTLFTVTFTVGASATGQLPVTIVQTVLSNSNAGYTTPEAVPILIGALENQPDLTLAYPVLPFTIVAGAVTVGVVFVDNDLDGIDDAWENVKFGNLTTANATSDFDNDGYSDKQEYLNSKNGETDPNGNPYEPKVKNASGGTGYVPPVSTSKKLFFDYGATWGLWTYDITNKWVNILAGYDPDAMLSVDMNNDGNDDIVVGYPGFGLYVYDSATAGWEQINTVIPENIIKNGNGIVCDYGATWGLWTYDITNKWVNILAGYDPDAMLSVDMNNDGNDDIVVGYPGFGLYVYDSATAGWEQINTVIPENIIKNGNGIVCDYGATWGLWTYDITNKWVNILAGYDPDAMLSVDMNNDGNDDIVVGYPGFGLYVYDSATAGWEQINTVIPENIIKNGNGIVCDYGATWGLWTYDITNKWVNILAGYDPDAMLSVDMNNDGNDDIVVGYPGFGLYVYDSATTGWEQINTVTPQKMITANSSN